MISVEFELKATGDNVGSVRHLENRLEADAQCPLLWPLGRLNSSNRPHVILIEGSSIVAHANALLVDVNGKESRPVALDACIFSILKIYS
jgi:hypothetical protein